MKISFSFLTLLLYLLLILSGYINYLVIFLFIMFIHELGHIVMIKLLRYKINSITILPTGGIIDTNINLNIKSNHLFLISISGILFQIILEIIIPSSSSYNYIIFNKINISLVIFNLIPINPLDGYKIFISMVERFLKYKYVIYLSYITSFIFIFILFFYSKNIIIFVFLYILNVKNVLYINYLYNKFLLERHLYSYVYKKDKYVSDLFNIYKNRNNYIKKEYEYIEEYIALNNYFGGYKR